MDIFGVLVVTGWLGIMGAYAYKLNVGELQIDQEALPMSDEVQLEPGESWLVVMTEQKEEIGYVHETRTAVPHGWLFEYDMFLALRIMGIERQLDSATKATLDEHGNLIRFVTQVKAAGREFELKGKINDKLLTMHTRFGEDISEKTVELKQRPKLSANALNHIVARDDLTKGKRYGQEFFDPTSMGFKKITFEYQGRKDVDVYGKKYNAMHFKELVAGNELDVFVNDKAEVLIQEFPMRTVGISVGAVLGRAQSKKIRREAEERQKKAQEDSGAVAKGKASSVDLSMQAAQRMLGLGRQASPEVDKSELTGRYELVESKPVEGLAFSSGRQRVLSTQGNKRVLEIEEAREGGHKESLSETQREALLASSPRMDQKSEAIKELIKDIDPKSEPRDKANLLGVLLDRRLVPGADIQVKTAEAILSKGEGDCTEFSLVGATALRALGLPTRFVFGVRFKDGKPMPHQWLQYFAGEEPVDVDFTRGDRGFSPGPDTVQMGTSAAPEDARYLSAIDAITLRPIAKDSDTAGAQDAADKDVPDKDAADAQDAPDKDVPDKGKGDEAPGDGGQGDEESKGEEAEAGDGAKGAGEGGEDEAGGSGDERAAKGAEDSAKGAGGGED